MNPLRCANSNMAGFCGQELLLILDLELEIVFKIKLLTRIWSSRFYNTTYVKLVINTTNKKKKIPNHAQTHQIN